jgi:hypothetical protein
MIVPIYCKHEGKEDKQGQRIIKRRTRFFVSLVLAPPTPESHPPTPLADTSMTAAIHPFTHSCSLFSLRQPKGGWDCGSNSSNRKNGVRNARRNNGLIESNAKCRYLKKLTYKGTFRQV